MKCGVSSMIDLLYVEHSYLPVNGRPSFPLEGDALVRRQYKTTKARQNASGMGCEFALPFVFSPYFADTYEGKSMSTTNT